MINNKQVNIWRGDDYPPTHHHIWLYKDLSLKIWDGEKWVVFMDDPSIGERLNQILEIVKPFKSFMDNSTVNNKLVKNNPVLDASDLKTVESGNYIKGNDTISKTLKDIDSLLKTQVIE